MPLLFTLLISIAMIHILQGLNAPEARINVWRGIGCIVSAFSVIDWMVL